MNSAHLEAVDDTNTQTQKTFVLDTNVLMHDPSALFRFEEHDIFLPMTVIEELDHAKKGMSEVSRNARQASRFLDELLQNKDAGALENGLPIRMPDALDLPGSAHGSLFFQTRDSDRKKRGTLPDNLILGAVMAYRKLNAARSVILVTKDINLRIKATVAGIKVQDYQNDQALDDLSLLYNGTLSISSKSWSEQRSMESWTEGSHTYYRIDRPEAAAYPNQCVFVDDENSMEAIVENQNDAKLRLRIANDYRKNREVWGINARNREQNFALNLLMDPEIDFISLLGTAGTGKTLLSLAAGLAQTMEDSIYNEIIVTRATVPVGDDIGFLPGTEEEKMTPWMGALSDNLEVLAPNHEGGEWGRMATSDLLSQRIKIRSLNFMRGRTFLNKFLILDEAQNLTPKQMKTLVTRAGPGTKIVCLGNIQQIDTPYLTETTSGITYAVDRFKSWQHSGHITLRTGERSRLADFASQSL